MHPLDAKEMEYNNCQVTSFDDKIAYDGDSPSLVYNTSPPNGELFKTDDDSLSSVDNTSPLEPVRGFDQDECCLDQIRQLSRERNYSGAIEVLKKLQNVNSRVDEHKGVLDIAIETNSDELFSAGMVAGCKLSFDENINILRTIKTGNTNLVSLVVSLMLLDRVSLDTVVNGTNMLGVSIYYREKFTKMLLKNGCKQPFVNPIWFMAIYSKTNQRYCKALLQKGLVISNINDNLALLLATNFRRYELCKTILEKYGIITQDLIL